MNVSKLQRANELRINIEVLSEWLENGIKRPMPFGPGHMLSGNMLSADAQKRIRAIAQADVEVQLSQLKQEFEAL